VADKAAANVVSDPVALTPSVSQIQEHLEDEKFTYSDSHQESLSRQRRRFQKQKQCKAIEEEVFKI